MKLLLTYKNNFNIQVVLEQPGLNCLNKSSSTDLFLMIFLTLHLALRIWYMYELNARSGKALVQRVWDIGAGGQCCINKGLCVGV